MEETIHNTVNEHRLSMGLTQEELAERLGVTRQTVISIEKGNYTPSVLLAIKIATLFECPVEEIFSIVCQKKS
jgi:putative transcriptional regulator